MLVIQISEKDGKIGYNGKPFDQLNESEIKDFIFFANSHQHPKKQGNIPNTYYKSELMNNCKNQVIHQVKPNFVKQHIIRPCKTHSVGKHGYCLACHEKVI